MNRSYNSLPYAPTWRVMGWIYLSTNKYNHVRYSSRSITVWFRNKIELFPIYPAVLFCITPPFMVFN